MTHYHRERDKPLRLHRGAEKAEVILAKELRGEGCCEEDPAREVLVIYAPDGRYLAEVDQFLDDQADENYAIARTHAAFVASFEQMSAAAAVGETLRLAVLEALSHPSVKGRIRQRLQEAVDR